VNSSYQCIYKKKKKKKKKKTKGQLYGKYRTQIKEVREKSFEEYYNHIWRRLKLEIITEKN
jgi:hypothetical protein